MGSFWEMKRGRGGACLKRMHVCPRCNAHSESIMHMLRDCEDIHNFWSKHINQTHWSKFFSLGLEAWLGWNQTLNGIGITPWIWQILFDVAVWALWQDNIWEILREKDKWREGKSNENERRLREFCVLIRLV